LAAIETKKFTYNCKCEQGVRRDVGNEKGLREMRPRAARGCGSIYLLVRMHILRGLRRTDEADMSELRRGIGAATATQELSFVRVELDPAQEFTAGDQDD
jgi:hypothetical protein